MATWLSIQQCVTHGWHFGNCVTMKFIKCAFFSGVQWICLLFICGEVNWTNFGCVSESTLTMTAWKGEELKWMVDRKQTCRHCESVTWPMSFWIFRTFDEWKCIRMYLTWFPTVIVKGLFRFAVTFHFQWTREFFLCEMNISTTGVPEFESYTNIIRNKIYWNCEGQLYISQSGCSNSPLKIKSYLQ